ncbi:hypothetical protein X777_03597, partial [Ooceraea biroi]
VGEWIASKDDSFFRRDICMPERQEKIVENDGKYFDLCCIDSQTAQPSKGCPKNILRTSLLPKYVQNKSCGRTCAVWVVSFQ